MEIYISENIWSKEDYDNRISKITEKLNEYQDEGSPKYEENRCVVDIVIEHLFEAHETRTLTKEHGISFEEINQIKIDIEKDSGSHVQSITVTPSPIYKCDEYVCTG